MASKEEIIEIVKKGIELENKIVQRAKKTVEDMKNPLIKELVLGIALDSEKHANMLQGLIDLLESRTPYIEEEEKDTIGNDINEHIQLENEAIREYSELLKDVDKREMKLILNYLIEDEKRHHSLLKRIQKWIIEAQTLTEEEWWDIMWKDTLFHGSPLG